MRRSASLEAVLGWDYPPYGQRPAEVVSPGTILRLRGVKDRNDLYKVNYYSRQDSLHCVWLIDPQGGDQTWDQGAILKDFEIVTPSTEKDLWGLRKPELSRP